MAAATKKAQPSETLVTSTFQSPVGPLTAAVSDRGLCLLEFAGPRSESHLQQIARKHHANAKSGSHPVLTQVRQQLDEYFAGKRKSFSVPMTCEGTTFQKKVWQQLLRIPFGETQSYADVARSVKTPKAFRAVGRANGQNPICIIVPCHRVVNADGQLGGYGGGLHRKKFLLNLEKNGH